MPDKSADITVLLRQMQDGDRAAENQLYDLLMPDLQKIAARCLRRERPNHTLQRTELVHELFMKLAGAKKVIEWRDRGHFFAICTIKMRRFLIDYARKRPTPQFMSIEDLPEGMMAGRNRLEVALVVNSLLDELEKDAPVRCAILVAKMYLGYEVQEIAERFGMNLRKVERELHEGRKWLFTRLSKVR
ncbi:MAG TPA: sigma-70 family RNA polymerase sigma factor [Candidatus Angelobacter sp.]|nr:sigma-70 family RNA polymerase sigma factor [Candidatus Angelobacter sp.]